MLGVGSGLETLADDQDLSNLNDSCRILTTTLGDKILFLNPLLYNEIPFRCPILLYVQDPNLFKAICAVSNNAYSNAHGNV